jgi:Uri superfamily endonuclease
MQASKETSKHLVIAAERTKEHLDYLLRENEYQQLLLARKIAAVEKKHAAQVRLAQLADFLNSRQVEYGKSFAPHQTIANKAARALATNATATLMEYELKQEVLVLEKLLLDSKLRKITKIPENKDNN